MNWNELENGFSILRNDPNAENKAGKYLHFEELGAVTVIRKDEPGFLDENGRYYLDELHGEYGEDPEGPYRMANEEGLKIQADDLSRALARGRRDDSSTGAFETFKGYWSPDEDYWSMLTRNIDNVN